MKTISLAAGKLHFTSDPHFYHSKMLGLRGHDSVEAMHDAMQHEWELSVRPTDTVIFLGDISFAGTTLTVDVLSRFRSHKILVRGNHDLGMSGAVLSLFDSVHDILSVKVQDGEETQRIVCCHFPMLSWDQQHRGAWMLHGHSHGSCQYPNPRPRILDVGVDSKLGFPISYAQVKAFMQLKAPDVVTADHHKPLT